MQQSCLRRRTACSMSAASPVSTSAMPAPHSEALSGSLLICGRVLGRFDETDRVEAIHAGKLGIAELEVVGQGAQRAIIVDPVGTAADFMRLDRHQPQFGAVLQDARGLPWSFSQLKRTGAIDEHAARAQPVERAGQHLALKIAELA